MKKPLKKKSESSLKGQVLWIAKAWPADVSVCFVPNEKKWQELLKTDYNITDEPYPTSDAQVTTLQKDKEQHCLVTITDCNGREQNEVIGLLAHEATHCWQKIRDWMKEKEPGIEFEAYTVGWITQNLLACFQQSRGDKLKCVN